jgi:peroxiredoxin (alkyl hydroperoxide reductase subunit C)
MAQDEKVEGCVASAAGPVGPAAEPAAEPAQDARTQSKEEAKMQVMVGKPAPDFEAAAFHQGGFKNLKLSDYKGQWVFLCFYPGDFTFV